MSKKNNEYQAIEIARFTFDWINGAVDTLTTAAVNAHAYSVNITDTHAIAPSNYTVYWGAWGRSVCA